MSRLPEAMLVPRDRRALVAIDLGAESCRVSMLRWLGGRPHVSIVHRFSNAPRSIAGGLRWNLGRIETELLAGLRRCAAVADEGVRSIAVDGWAVDYVRLDSRGEAVEDPFCYRDTRTLDAETLLHRQIAPERLRALTGVQTLRINTLYQMYADVLEQRAGGRWLNLPEYILSRLGGVPVAEYTNATHTQMIEMSTRQWCPAIFQAASLDLGCAPEIVPAGTLLGALRGELAALNAFRETVLVAPACHDTASAVAGIPDLDGEWAYISAGTWSLVGTVLDHPQIGQALAENFTNLGAVGQRVSFHKNVNGMWLLQQCMATWASEGALWTVPALVGAAARQKVPNDYLDVDDPELLLAGAMPQRINAQRERAGLQPLPGGAEHAPAYASLIFHSLARRYAEVLDRVAAHSGKRFSQLVVVGGASQNALLNRLTEEATGARVIRGAVESSTLGNFAVQLAALEEEWDKSLGVSAKQVSGWATLLAGSRS